MSSPISTVPAAAAALKAYMDAVAADNPSLNVATSIGKPTESNRNNFMMVGDYETGLLVNPTTYDWAAIPGQAKIQNESYELLGAIECAGGAGGPEVALARLNDAYTLLNGLMDQIKGDLQGVINAQPGDAPLTTSGSWGSLTVEMLANGPKGTAGWGVVLKFELAVINAQLIG